MKSREKALKELYQSLLKSYGPQGWWPLLDFHGKNPTKTGSVRGYHPGDYSFPKTEEQAFEICIGAILTQNIAWPNVEKSLLNLKARRALSPKALLRLPKEELRILIRPSGYFNQKAKKLRIFTLFFLKIAGRTPSREELLALWGIGPETADSMLLYAWKQPTFVVDAYTRKTLLSLKIISAQATYDDIKDLFESNIGRDVPVYQEFHALLVEHAKRSRGAGKIS